MDGKIITVVLMLTIAGAIIVSGLVTEPHGPQTNKTDLNQSPTSVEGGLKKFSTPEEIASFLKEKEKTGGQRGYRITIDMAAAPMLEKAGAQSASESVDGAADFSTTNIQVAGVDEADIVKNDGRYIYQLAGNTVSIVDAYPAESAKLLSQIEIEGDAQEIFINRERLIVLGNRYDETLEKRLPSPAASELVEPYPGRMNREYASLFIYNIEDREAPALLRSVALDGYYFDSRMIGDYVYIIANEYPRYYDDVIVVPEVSDSEGINLKPDVYYFDEPDYSYSFTTIASVNTQSTEDPVEAKVYLLGSAQNMFISQKNVYITYQRMMPEPVLYERAFDTVLQPLVPIYVSAEINRIKDSDLAEAEKQRKIERVVGKYFDALTDSDRQRLEELAGRRFEKLEREQSKKTEKTVVHKIAIADGSVEYKAGGSVPGRVLNQFSMDEYNGYFRIATTTGQVSRGGGLSANNIYILDGELEIQGALEDLAPGERIYSARFMGERAYLVTFKKVDPLFVIGLADPKNPRLLGKLKIPGYSDYLHPYDENHVIGLGKEAAPAENGDFAWYQGLKIALFDVSDVSRPKEISKVSIGERGTDSYALRDHRAFLFNREKNLLVIPVLLAEIYEDQYPAGLPEWAYGEYVWQGAYVFSLDTETGFELKGRISHVEDESLFLKSGSYYPGSEYSVKRSLYMDNVLYTISEGRIKMNSLDDLREINSLDLPVQRDTYYGYLE
ncbi:beta propeller domain protein [archaeon BMS3Bbin16]|nr:beta propeller domain protein [archaeon BMS3Bbin16]